MRAQNAPQPEIRLNVAYGADPAQQLDLCLPETNSATLHPAVVMIHGGYWTMGDKNWYAGLCKMAASQGIVAASIGYRLGNDSPHNRWPAQLVDAQLAVRWMRAHARDFAIDPAKICALGDSAGAHLAVFLAALDHTFPGDDAGELPGVSSRVACAVDNFGPVDLTVDTFWPPGPQLFGVKQGERAKDQEVAASPLFLIGPKTAPIFIAQGRDDKSVNIGQSQELYARLQQSHVPARLVLLNGGHEFSGLPVPEMMKTFQDELDFIKRPSAGS
ncbi:MAG TPA: alpha/beta hydrolase [Stellaceae bacterium]|nr:alpha/beta hydrolase [Stellaceae bacterium]